MITTAAIVLGLLLTLALPIFPNGIEASILAFFGLAALGGAGGLLSRAARHELVAMAPWLLALVVALAVGGARHGDTQQALEDALPYTIFVLGLVAGRGLRRPRIVLQVALAVCAIDSAISLWLMPEFEPGVRSTYMYHKIIGGLPLVGMFVATLLRKADPPGERPRLFVRVLHAGAYVVMFVAMVASVSRGMMLGWLLGISVMAYVRRPSRAVGLGIAAAVVLVLYSGSVADIGTRYFRVAQAGTIEARYHEIRAAWEAFTHHPAFGQGLGASLVADGSHRAYVHNMAVYHLWKFGIVGTMLLLVPFFVIGRELRRTSAVLRATVIGGSAGITGYLITCATYKTYYVVWIYGIVAGATLTLLGHVRLRAANSSTALTTRPAGGHGPGSTPCPSDP